MTTPAESHRHTVDVELTGETLEVYQLGDATIIALGRIELTHQVEVSNTMNQLRDVAMDAASSTIVLDCRRVEAVGSILLGELISLNKALATVGKRLRLASLNHESEIVIQISGLSQMLPVYADVKAAVFANSKRRWWWPFGK